MSDDSAAAAKNSAQTNTPTENEQQKETTVSQTHQPSCSKKNNSFRCMLYALCFIVWLKVTILSYFMGRNAAMLWNRYSNVNGDEFVADTSTISREIERIPKFQRKTSAFLTENYQPLDSSIRFSSYWKHALHRNHSNPQSVVHYEAIIHPALLTHPDPKSVLIVNDSTGGLLREVVKYKALRRIKVILFEEGGSHDAEPIWDDCSDIIGVPSSCREDKRVEIVFAKNFTNDSDGYTELFPSEKKFDAVYIQPSDDVHLKQPSSDTWNSRMNSVRLMKEARQVLTKEGLLVVPLGYSPLLSDSIDLEPYTFRSQLIHDMDELEISSLHIYEEVSFKYKRLLALALFYHNCIVLVVVLPFCFKLARLSCFSFLLLFPFFLQVPRRDKTTILCYGMQRTVMPI